MKQSEEVVRQEAQQQAEDAFNGFMLLDEDAAQLWSCLFSGGGCRGVQCWGRGWIQYPAYNGEQYDPYEYGHKQMRLD